MPPEPSYISTVYKEFFTLGYICSCPYEVKFKLTSRAIKDLCYLVECLEPSQTKTNVRLVTEFGPSPDLIYLEFAISEKMIEKAAVKQYVPDLDNLSLRTAGQTARSIAISNYYKFKLETVEVFKMGPNWKKWMDKLTDEQKKAAASIKGAIFYLMGNVSNLSNTDLNDLVKVLYSFNNSVAKSNSAVVAHASLMFKDLSPYRIECAFNNLERSGLINRNT